MAVAGGALVFSSSSQAAKSRRRLISSTLGEARRDRGCGRTDGAPLLHGPAVPRRRPVANTAPAYCELSGIADLLLPGRAPGLRLRAGRRKSSDALACAGSAYDNSPAISRDVADARRRPASSRARRRVTTAGYELYACSTTRSAGCVLAPRSTRSAPLNSSQPCTEASGACPSCDTSAWRAGAHPTTESKRCRAKMRHRPVATRAAAFASSCRNRVVRLIQLRGAQAEHAAGDDQSVGSAGCLRMSKIFESRAHFSIISPSE